MFSDFLRFARKIDKFNILVGGSVALLNVLLVLNVFAIVVLRYFFGENLIWQSEISEFISSLIFLTAAGYTYFYNNHVKVDILFEKFSEYTKAYINIIGIITLLIPMVLGISYFSWGYVASSWAIFESSGEPGGMYGVFLFKSLIFLFCSSLFLQSLSVLIKSISKVRKFD